MSKELLLGQVATTRRRFMKRILGGGAVLLAIPASTILNAAPQDDQGKGGDGDGKGDGKGKGKGDGGDQPQQ